MNRDLDMRKDETLCEKRAMEESTLHIDDLKVGILSEVGDDFLFAKLLGAQGEVELLKKECAKLRADQVFDQLFDPARGETSATVETSSAKLQEQVTILTEQYNDAKIEIKRLNSELKLNQECAEDATSRCTRAVSETKRLRDGKVKELFGDLTEGTLRQQIGDLSDLKDKLESRAGMY